MNICVLADTADTCDNRHGDQESEYSRETGGRNTKYILHFMVRSLLTIWAIGLLFFPHILLLCSSFLSLPPTNNWEMTIQCQMMISWTIFNTITATSWYYMAFETLDVWLTGGGDGVLGTICHNIGTLCPRSGSCGTLIQNTRMRRMSEIQQPPCSSLVTMTPKICPWLVSIFVVSTRHVPDVP